MFKSKKIFSIHHRSLQEKFRASFFGLFVVFMGVVLPGGCTFWDSIVGRSSSKGTNKPSESSKRRQITQNNLTAQGGIKSTEPTGITITGAKRTKLQANRKRKRQLKKTPQVNVATDLQCGECKQPLLPTDEWHKLSCTCDKIYHAACIKKMEDDPLIGIQCKFCHEVVNNLGGVEKTVTVDDIDAMSSESEYEEDGSNPEDAQDSDSFNDSEGAQNEAILSSQETQTVDDSAHLQDDLGETSSASSCVAEEVPTVQEPVVVQEPVDPCAAYTKCSKCKGTNFDLFYLDTMEVGFEPYETNTKILKLCCTKCNTDHGRSCSKCNKSFCQHTPKLDITEKRSWQCANCKGINDYQKIGCAGCSLDDQKYIKNPYVRPCDICHMYFHIKDRGLDMYKCNRCNKRCSKCNQINKSFDKKCSECHAAI